MELSALDLKTGNQLHQADRNDSWRLKIEFEIDVARRMLAASIPNGQPDFDIRGALYQLALELAPDARSQELESLIARLNPNLNECGMDLAAGTGFLTPKHCL